MSESQENDTHSIALIYEDTHRSISQLISRIDSLNTRLTLILGFEAAFVKFTADLPGYSDVLEWHNPLLVGRCNFCMILKLFAFLALVVSIYYALRGILPVEGKGFLNPIAQLEDESAKNKAEFQEKVIRMLSKNSIPDLEKVLIVKANSLKHSLLALGAASTASAVNLIISTIFISR